MRAGEQSLYFKTGSLGNVFSGYTRSAQIMLAQYAAISNTKLRHKFFFLVICDDSYFHFSILSLYVMYYIFSKSRFISRFVFAPLNPRNRGEYIPVNRAATLSNAAFAFEFFI